MAAETWRRSNGTLRVRMRFAALALATMAVGLAVHWHGAALGPVARDVLGDALWAMMILWWASAVAPHARLRTRVAASLALCYAVEASQRLHSPALDAVRRTTIGSLVLGSGFDPRDLLAYTVGVLVAAMLVRGKGGDGWWVWGEG